MGFPVKRLVIAVFLTAFLGSGCFLISRKTKIPAGQQLLSAETRTRSELMQDLEERSSRISSLTAKVFLDLSSGATKTGVLTEYRQTTGILIIDRPKQVRIRVLAPVVGTTVVDMVSDGQQYKISIPVKTPPKFMIGDANAPPSTANSIVNLRPQHILDALFVDIRRYEENPQIKSLIEEATVGRVPYYILEFVDISGKEGQLLEKIWIDRTNLQIVRKQIFTTEGRVETDVQFSGYQAVAGITFPQAIAIQRPIEDYILRLTFQAETLKINEKLAADVFQLERPSGAELVQIDHPAPRPY